MWNETFWWETWVFYTKLLKLFYVHTVARYECSSKINHTLIPLTTNHVATQQDQLTHFSCMPREQKKLETRVSIRSNMMWRLVMSKGTDANVMVDFTKFWITKYFHFIRRYHSWSSFRCRRDKPTASGKWLFHSESWQFGDWIWKHFRSDCSFERHCKSAKKMYFVREKYQICIFLSVFLHSAPRFSNVFQVWNSRGPIYGHTNDS